MSIVIDGTSGVSLVQNGIITESKIASGAVTNTKIGALAVDNGKIADSAINSSKIADGEIDYVDLPSGSVIQMISYSDSTNVNTASTSYLNLIDLIITNVKSNSKIIIDAAINTLIEGSGIGYFSIWKGSTMLVESYHSTSGITGWHQMLPTLIATDSTPTAGSNTYSIKIKSSTPGLYYNYRNGGVISYSFYKLTEVKK